MLKDISFQAVFMGLLTAFVGFASSFPVVLQGLRSAGATEAQAASGLMAVAIAMGLSAIFLSLKSRNPIWIAWSTPGAALLASSGMPEFGFAEAVGAFIICGLMIIIAGLIKPLSQAISSIPQPIASAMLAGVVMSLCLAPFDAIAFDPVLGLPIFAAWVITFLIAPRLAVPAALLAFIGVMIWGVRLPEDSLDILSQAALPQPTWITPVFTQTSFFSIAFPLFIVTMASQNIPGLAVLKTYGYPLNPKLWFTTTGAFTVLGAPFGGHAVNLAAITAAMCASPEAHPNKSRRYWAAVIAGVASVAFGLLAGLITAFVTLAPSILIEAVAGLALITTFVTAIEGAFRDEAYRLPSAVTFLLTASGVTIAGISGAFWGLVAGLTIVLFTSRLR